MPVALGADENPAILPSQTRLPSACTRYVFSINCVALNTYRYWLFSLKAISSGLPPGAVVMALALSSVSLPSCATLKPVIVPLAAFAA